jgi:hypothetical protein
MPLQEVDGKSYITIAQNKPYDLDPILFIAGFEVADPACQFEALECAIVMPTELNGQFGGLTLEICNREKDLIKHAFTQGHIIDKETAKVLVRDHYKLDTKDLVGKCLSKCGRRELLVVILNKLFEGDNLIAYRLQLLSLQKARRINDPKLLNVLEQLDGPGADKYNSLKSHLQKKTKLSDTESNSENEDSEDSVFETDSEWDEDDDDKPEPKERAKPKFTSPEYYHDLMPGKYKYAAVHM